MYTPETTINKFPQVVTKIMAKARRINDEGRVFVIYTTCESFMEFVIEVDHTMSMYVVNNNSQHH